MSEGPHFSLARLGRVRKTQPSELDILLNLCPSMALAVDARNWSILLVNQAVLEITGYEQDELSDLGLQVLIPDWKPESWFKSPDQPRVKPDHTQGGRLTLKRKNLSKIPIQLIDWNYSADGKRLYVVMEAEPKPARSADKESPSEASSNHSTGTRSKVELGELFQSLQPTDLNVALSQILSSAQSLTGASILAVYSLSSNPAKLVCIARYGRSDWLPDNLPIQELFSLKNPQIWQTGIRPTSDLHRAAQVNKLAYLASVPFGKSKQASSRATGMLILAGEDEPAKDQLLQVSQEIALLITAVMQKANLVNQYQNILHNLDLIKILENVLQENITEGSLLLSPELNILDINAAAEKIIGFNHLEVRGQPVEHVLIGTETLLAALRKVSENQGSLPPLEGRLYRRTGEAVAVKMLAHPVIVQGRLESILILIQDLTEIEHAREQAHQLEQRAILGEITAVFAHEVRNPINNISTGLELVSLNLAADDPNRPTITRLLQDCDRLAELMKSVLAYSRPAEYTMSRVPLEPFFQNLLERSRPRMERLNVQGSLQVAPDCPSITGSPRALEQVFINLINNAVQAMSDTGGQLMIKVQRAQEEDFPVVLNREAPSSKSDPSRRLYSTALSSTDYVEVNVIDTGPGIPQEVQERIFQPFYTTNFTGTGLGLAIAKRILTAHRGNISVTSFPGGTVFRVLLPASE